MKVVTLDKIVKKTGCMRKKDSDIDTGWAWFVLVAVYLGIIILSTTMFMGGVLYVALLEHFDADEAKTSLVGALNGGLLCLLGPIASFVMTTFSCRVCMFVGGLLSAISCLTSAFVGSVDILILTYGVIGGIGNCLTSTPFVVVLGYYFHKRRNIVIAISQAVIGVGFFLASPLAIIIIRNYGIQGTFLILGGINAHLCVIAIVCKPSSIEQQILLRTRNGSSLKNAKDNIDDETVVKLIETSINSETKLEVDREISKQYNLIADSTCSGNITNKLRNTDIYSEADKACSEMNKAAVDRQDYLHVPSPNQITTGEEKDQPKLIVYTPSRDKTYEQLELYEINGNSMTNIECNQTESEKLVKLPQGCVCGRCNLQLLKDMPFTMFLFSTLSWNFTLSICIMHLPNYVKIKGADDVAISAIMTCFSASNLAGRFIAAMTVENGGVDSHTLHVGMLGVAGVVTLLFPFYSGPVGDYIFATVIGLYTGGPNSIMTPITLKMVKIDDLPAAHGLEYFFSGLGYVPGPFIAGLLYRLSGAYEFSFITGGSILLIGCLLAMISAINTSRKESTKA